MAAEAIARALRDGAVEGEHSPALTIKDSIQSPLGPFLFNHVLTQLSSTILASKSQAQGIVLVAFARSPQFYAELLRSKTNGAIALSKWVRILDCYSDPLGWKTRLVENGIISNPSIEIATTTSLCENVKDLDCLFSLIIELGKDFVIERKARFAVAIDSVSEILRHLPATSTASLLSNLRSHDHVSCAFWTVHSDLHEAKTISALEYMSSMVANVEPMYKTTNNNSENLPVVEQNFLRGKFYARFKRRNGRIRLKFEELHIEQKGIKFVPASEDGIISQNLVPKVQFNLQLSEKERNDRAKVVLPFEHQGNDKPIHIYDGRKSLSEGNTENKDSIANKLQLTKDLGRELQQCLKYTDGHRKISTRLHCSVLFIIKLSSCCFTNFLLFWNKNEEVRSIHISSLSYSRFEPASNLYNRSVVALYSLIDPQVRSCINFDPCHCSCQLQTEGFSTHVL